MTQNPTIPWNPWTSLSLASQAIDYAAVEQRYLARKEKGEAFHAALEELFRQHPVQGGMHHPKKAKGVRRVEERRSVALSMALNGGIFNWGENDMIAYAKAWRIPVRQFMAIHALIYR